MPQVIPAAVAAFDAAAASVGAPQIGWLAAILRIFNITKG